MSVSFRDPRPPHEVQAAFEQLWSTVLSPNLVQDQLTYAGTAHIIGAPYSFLIQYEGRSLWKHIYTLQVTIHLSQVAPENIDYFIKDSKNWFDFWTSKLDRCEPSLLHQIHTLAYSKTVQEALSFEAVLDTPATLQHLILSALKDGMYFSTSHKEGGTNIRFLADRYQRSDYGESNTHQSFSDAQSFLEFLRRFFEFTVSRNCGPGKLSEYQIWRLIYRLLNRP